MPELKNKKHELFCIHYVDSMNGTQAAIAAGYAEKNARVQASRLLSNDNIRQRKDELIVEKLGETKDELKYKILNKFKEIAFADVSEYVTIEEGSQKFIDLIDDIMDNTDPDDLIRNGALKDLQDYLLTSRVIVKNTADMEKTSAIAQIKQGRNGIEISFHDPVKALEKLSEYAGLFQKEEGRDKPVNVNLTVEDRRSRIEELLKEKEK